MKMEYRVINDFIDKDNKDTLYQVGEEYPKGNYKPTKKRIEELSQEHPTYKRVFIEEVKEDDANGHHE
jgi:hypothetical protein